MGANGRGTPIELKGRMKDWAVYMSNRPAFLDGERRGVAGYVRAALRRDMERIGAEHPEIVDGFEAEYPEDQSS